MFYGTAGLRKSFPQARRRGGFVEIFVAPCHTGAPTGIPLLRMFTLASKDGLAQRFEQREPAWFQNEFSDVVRDPLLKTLTEIRFLGLHYKAFAETKSAGWLV